MKKRFRKLTALLLTLALVCSLLPGTVLGADQAVNTSLPAASKGKTLRILAVGNSYSVDSLQYLYQMGKSAGYELVIGNLYHGGRSLEEQWNSWKKEENDYTYYKISAKTDGTWIPKSKTTLKYGVKDEPWDIITLQQSSGLSGVPTSYYSSNWNCTGVGESVSLPEQAKTSVLSAVQELAQVTTQPEAQTPQQTEEPEAEPAQAEDAQTADIQAAEDAAEPVEEPTEDTPAPSEGDTSAEPADNGISSGDGSASSSSTEPVEPTEPTEPTEPIDQVEPSAKRSEQTITCGIQKDSWGDTGSVSLRASAKTDLTYASSNSKVMTVDKNGRVTFLRTGKAVITITAAQSEQYYGARCKVTMKCERTNLTKSLQDALRRACSNQKVRFGWNITWAYAQPSQWVAGKTDSFQANYEEYYNADQMTMYEAITDSVVSAVVPIGGFSVYIPTGTAIQNLRSSYIGDNLSRDGVHLSWSLGRYTAAMTWAAALGMDVNQITYRPSGSNAVSLLDVAAVRASVTDAIETPLALTASSHTTAPALANTQQFTLTNEASGIRLTWKKTSKATGYRIWRKEGNGSFQPLAKITSGQTTTYVDTEVQKKSNVTYTYSIRAISGALSGPYPPHMAPANQRKTILRLSAAGEVAANEKNGIKLTWSKVSGAEGYRIYRSDRGGQKTLLKTVKNTVTAYVDKTVASQNGKSYTYTVQPYSGQWDGPAKGLKVVRLTGVTLKKAAKSGSHIKLTWTRNSQAKGYEVYRKMGSGKWTKVKTIAKNSTLTYTDKAVKRGKTYSYKVCACKDTSTSLFSNTKTLKR